MFIASNHSASSKLCLTKTDALVGLLVKRVKATNTDIIVNLSTSDIDGIVVSYPRRFSLLGTNTTDTIHNIVNERAKDFNVTIKHI